MYREKNYKRWFNGSLVLFILTLITHISGYFTNVLYILAWMLWMPVIALFLVCVFDYLNTVRIKPMMRKNIINRENVKTPLTVFLCVTAVYVLFNLIYGFAMLSEAGDLQTVEGIYYSVKGDTMTEISYETYVKYALSSFRLLSGHSLLFVAIPMWYWGIRNNMAKSKVER